MTVSVEFGCDRKSVSVDIPSLTGPLHCQELPNVLSDEFSDRIKNLVQRSLVTCIERDQLQCGFEQGPNSLSIKPESVVYLKSLSPVRSDRMLELDD